MSLCIKGILSKNMQNNNIVEPMTPQEKNALKLEYNKKMLGKRVFVTSTIPGYFGVVLDVIDINHFRVKSDKGEENIVEIFDIRSIE